MTRIREYRDRRGLSQQALADRLDVSRQTVSSVESGRQSPSVRLALRIARILDCQVEDLFPADGPDVVQARYAPSPNQRPSASRRVAVGRVGEGWVAHALDPSDPGSCDGVADVSAQASDIEVSLIEAPEVAGANVLVAGCAPLLATLADRAGATRPGTRMHWIKASSGRALDLLQNGLVHVAGMHLIGDVEHSEVVADRFRSEEMVIMNLTSWRQGLVVAKGNPLGLGPDDLGRPGIRRVWREEGASARQLMLRTAGSADESLGNVVLGHFDVAEAVAAGRADVGVAIEAVAVAYGLDFVPLTSERFDLVFRRSLAPAVERVLDVVDSAAFKAEAGAFGGYDTSLTGHAFHVSGASA